MLFAEEELVQRHVGRGEYRGLEFLHVNARRVINEVPAASRMPFRFTINAYRGCSHACAYCFARPTHEYLGLDMGEDFERKLVVKVNAVERVRAELRSPRWRGDHIAMGTNTDPYQRAEGRYHLTRGIIGALGEAANPFSILTKSTLILRDLDLLVAAAARTEVHCNLSIGTLDEAVWKATEPGTPHPRQRVEAVRRLNDAGIPTGVLVAPIIPGWSDTPEQLAEVATACVEAGAVFVTPIALHLRRGVKEHFLAFLKDVRPDLHAEMARRYARSAYLSPAEQREITERVDTMVQPGRRRRSTADTFGHRGSGRDGSPPQDTGAVAAPAAEQLAFLPTPRVRPR
jgi:DNA repair photolyase